MTEDRDPLERNGTAQYRIGAVARITGVSAHTIRIWERRYQLLNPMRTPGGTRVYSEADLQRLKAVHELVEQGHAISTIAHLSNVNLRQMLRRHHPSTTPAHADSEAMTRLRTDYLREVSEMRLDEAEAMLSRAMSTLPPRVLIFEFIVPLLHEVGTRWENGTLRVAHEHAVSAMVRGQLAPLAHRLGVSRGRAIACTPSGELHEFGALLAALVAVLLGWNVTYLGPNLPADEIAYAAVESATQFILLSCVSMEVQAARAEIQRVRALVPPQVSILVGGRASASLGLEQEGIVVEQSLQGLEARLMRS